MHPILEKKVDVLFGEKFASLPPYLTCIINRFDFDYQRMVRCKVYDMFEFPHVLNMNNYMKLLF